MRILDLYSVLNRIKSQLHFLHVLKYAKIIAARALLASAKDELIKVFLECAINTLIWNHKLTKDLKSKLMNYMNYLRALVNSIISFKIKRKMLIQKGRDYGSIPRMFFVGCNRNTN